MLAVQLKWMLRALLSTLNKEATLLGVMGEFNLFNLSHGSQPMSQRHIAFSLSEGPLLTPKESQAGL